MTIKKFSFRGSLGLGLSALLVIGCSGDDGDTAGSASDSSTGDTDSTTTSTSNTTPGTASATGSTSTSGGSMSAGETTGSSSITDTSPTSGTDTDPTGGGACGDGVLDPGEECDDGASNGTARSICDSDCTVKGAVCGNGIEESGEECDDGNLDPGDGCDENCVTEVPDPVCGNGVLEDGEACDDGNLDNDDGCESDCTETPPGECGNGVLEWDELCDDGNQTNGDGCEADCTPTPLPSCLAPEDYISCDGALNKNDPLAAFQAIGLACSDNNQESILISDTSLNSANPNAWQIAKGFGTYMEMGKLLYSSREGESFLMLSSGVIKAPNNQGVVIENSGSQTGNGNNNNDDSDTFLPGYTPADDESGVLQPQWMKGNSNPNDKIWLTFKTNTPTGVKGYAIDFAFFSSEWPTYYDTIFNDLFVIWQVHEDFTGNVSTIGDLPTTITALHPHWTNVMGGQKTCANFGTNGPGFSCNEPQLAGTGFEGHAGTTWIRINQPFDGMDDDGKDLTMYFFLADMADSILATGALIDRFRWACDECIPANDPKCTGEVPDPNCCGVVLPM